MIATASFADFIREEAALIHADGCTGVTNWNGVCCLIHDCEGFYGKNAADAYGRYRGGDTNYWRNAKAITFSEWNAHFRACHFRESQLGHLNPLAWIRYWVVKGRKGRAAWDAHRSREAADLGVADAV